MRKRSQKGKGDFLEGVRQDVARNKGISSEEAGRWLAKETCNYTWVDGVDRSPTFFQNITNPRNFDIAASIGGRVLTDVVAPIVTGKVPNPYDVYQITRDGVSQVMKGKGFRRKIKL